MDGDPATLVSAGGVVDSGDRRSVIVNDGLSDRLQTQKKLVTMLFNVGKKQTSRREGLAVHTVLSHLLQTPVKVLQEHAEGTYHV